MFDCGGYRVQYIDGEKERFSRLEESSPRSSVASNSNSNSNTFRNSFFNFRNPLRSFTLSLPFLAPRSTNFIKTPNKNKHPKMLDPSDKFLLRLNRFFVMLCIVAVAVDPLVFYLPVINYQSNCVGIDKRLAVVSTVVRTIIDIFYLPKIVLKFRTAYSTSTRVGAGDLITHPTLVARRYFKTYFFMDLFAVLPIPQIMIWRYLNSSVGSKVLTTKRALFLMVVIPFFPRLFRLYPLMTELKSTVGVFIETAWAGAAYYLLWFMLAGHNVGTFWYLLSLMRQDDCWHELCHNTENCSTKYLYCGNENLPGSDIWKNMNNTVQTQCSTDIFHYGIYAPSISKQIIASHNFVTKASYCFWWGLQNLSTLGQGLQTSTYTGEVIFSIVICVLGLLLFALLIGNMQTYLQSLSIRLEEMRVKKHDAEQWMHHRLLPPSLRERVRRFEHYRWLETRGVDEEGLVQTLPKDLRRDIKRHLTLNLVKRVPLFADMDDRLLDAVCERLKPSLYTEATYVLKEGEPVDEMLFIVRGSLESITTDGGRTGFFNRGLLKEGDFCGEELLTWALDPKSSLNFPASTRTVRSLSEVEAFALGADDLKFVATQFRRLHSRQVQHTFRYHSQHWRTWAACFIQAAWRRYWRRKIASNRRREEARGSRPSLGATIYASRFAANALRGVHNFRNRGGGASSNASTIVRLQKPPEPDFSVDAVN
ncbi:cyclic nucleotide-gated channel 6 [Rhynchospora pubera]|uniref:Cyclic nucleotide-gated channel 6 n=1 Tax=Rhynchospora pubera TaxID=906938 RepID=A0AAV8HD13_9POAL|nr:cyclic nucleotide-gated channel 6 [Rhynchospora pubera]